MPVWDEEDPGLPIKLNPCSNGEYDPLPPTPVVREAVRRARAATEVNARRAGLSRRQFLRSAAGAATTLAALAACSDESNGGRSGGTYSVPPESTVDPEAAEEVLGGDELVFDVQGHLLEYDPATPVPPGFFGNAFPQSQCGDDDPRACFTTSHFLEEVFLRSDTTMAVLSAIPVGSLPGGPLDAEVMRAAMREADLLCGDGRVLMQAHAAPSTGPFAAVSDSMEELARRYPLVAWKVYTHAGGPGWFLDDHNPAAPQVGEAFLARVVELGVPVVAVHKGFGSGFGGLADFASPVDIGPAARAHPDVSFVVYHSGYEAGGDEGAYEDGNRDEGVNRLVSTVLDAGIEPGGNVYAELGSTWRSVMGSPDQAAHVIGKLLRHVGEDNVVWGTDSIWYGSPQDQIQAFRAFEISKELQERHGYPALTPAVKAKVLGGNSARLYGVDPVTAPCRPSRADRESARRSLPGDNRTYGPTTPAAVRAHVERFGWL
ncbi:MAG: amidohydrolase [Acidimicrobiia bacterium]|nr:amidohydrolase [Acidimicrobiia bacterium]